MLIAKKIVKFFLELSANILSKFKRIYFPHLYNWKMKLEFLFYHYEKDTVALCKKVIKPGMNIIDVGAHIGYYSILFSNLIGKNGTVYAFEPEPKHFEFLKKNVQGYSNTKIILKAVSNKSSIVEFYVSKGKTGCDSLFPADFREEKIRVNTITLDSFISEIGFPEINLVKIDIEGAEPYAIAGMKKLLNLNKDLMLIIEFCPKNLILASTEPIEFLKDLHQLGFNIYLVREKGEIELLKQNDIFQEISLIKQQKYYPKYYLVNLFCKK